MLATKSCEEVANSFLIVGYPRGILGHQLRPRTIHLSNIFTLQLINNLTLVSVTKFILDSKIVFMHNSNLKTKTKQQFFLAGQLSLQVWERARHHTVFRQTALSALTRSEYGCDNAQVLGFWVLPKCWVSIQNSTTLGISQLFITCS